MTPKYVQVETVHGRADVMVIECDECGKASTRDTKWGIPNVGWYHLAERARKEDGSPREEKAETDYCSEDCLIRHFMPGLYDADPYIVRQAIERLKRTEQDLAGRRDR